MRIILDTDNEQNFVDLWNPEKNNWERYIKCYKENKTLKHKENYVDFANLTEDTKFDYLYEMQTEIINKINKMENK